MRRFLRGSVGVLAFLVLWEFVGRSGLVQQKYLPPPTVVAGTLGRLLVDGGFLADTLATVLAAVIALLIAAAISVPAGLVLGTVPAIRNATGAIVEFLRPIPSVTFIPLAILVIGSGPETKIALAVYACVWPILFNTIYAMGEVDPVQVDTARSFGFSAARTLCTVALPNAAPFVLTGIRLAATTALVLVVSVELLASGSGGIGHIIFEASSDDGAMDVVLAGTVVAGLIGFLLDAGFRRVQRRWLAWGSGSEATR